METLGQAIQGIEEHMKAELARTFITHAYSKLSPANEEPWNRDGFYTARHAHELASHGFLLAQEERDFPVPADCPYWSNPFVEDQRVFRGFLRHAWLELPEVPAGAVLAVPTSVEHEVLSASIDGIVLSPFGKTFGSLQALLWTQGECPSQGVLHLRASSPVALTQHGRISCIVGKPFWLR